MFLKSLTLRGFKSFADKTTLALEPGISVIVGPNGSGKSNVVDAICWVLGEQGPRSLRGGRMEDVIFAGSAQRPALAMAEVALTIDNASGALPLEFAEVTITRTLFRSGEAEYRLNGLPCRLLDIREVLSDGGIGREQHTIIGQGHLDEMLTADPVQIRAYIEEAAGIAKHRQRKERALRRIAGTDANLVRLGDVLTEVRRQLRPLREQAEVAKRHGSMVEELERIRVVLTAREIAGIRRRLGPEGSVDLEGPIREAEQETADLDESLIAAGRERSASAGRVEASRETAWALRRVTELLRSLQRLAHERDRGLGAQLAGVTEAGAQARIDEVGRALEEVGPALDDAAGGCDRAEGTVAERRQTLAAAEAALADAQAAVAPLRQAQREAQAETVKVRGELAAASASLTSAERERTRAHERRGTVDASRRRATAVLEEATAALEALEATEAPQMEALAELEDGVDAGVAARQEALAQLAEAEREAATWRARAQVRAGASPRAVRALAQAGIAGVIGVLADLVAVPDGAKAALEALVGPAASVLVVEDAEAAERVLAAAGGGEPLGILIAGGSPDPGGPSLTERRLTELLSAADGPVAVALSGVYIAADTVQAARLAREHPQAAFVTVGGVMATGRLLARTSAAAGARAAAAEATLVSVRDRVTQLDAEIAASRAAFNRAASVLNRADADIAAATDRASSAERELHALEREAAVVDESEQRAGAAQASLRETVTRLTAALAAAESRAESAGGDLQGRADEQGVASAARGRAAAALEEARLELARATERRRLLQERRAELERAQAAAQMQAAAVSGRRADLTTRQEVASSVAERARLLGEASAEWTREAEDEAAACHRGAAEVEGRMAELQRRRTEVARTLDALRAKAREEDLSRAELRIRVRILEERLAEGGREAEDCVRRWGRRLVEDDPSLLVDPWDKACAAETEALERRQARLERDLASMGRVNPLAAVEFESLTEREEFLSSQIADLRSSRRDLLKVVTSVDDEILGLFNQAFADVAREYEQVFSTLFPGGTGRLRLSDPADPLETGVEVEARPGGKNLRRLSLLSGGERSLAALALSFAIFRARPSPFYVLDEVEAALDDINLHRFLELLKAFRSTSQLIVVTHQKRTMELADVLYGVSVRAEGVSRVISERLSQSSGLPGGEAGPAPAGQPLSVER